MYQANVYNIMIGCPSDIKEEINIAYDVINEWNYSYSQKQRIILQPLHWSKSSYATSGDEPQKILNKQLVQHSDVLICIFGSKIGTPTSDTDSGTIEELNLHNREGKRILVFFKKSVANIDDLDLEQVAKLKTLKNEIKKFCIFSEYETISDFSNVLLKNLIRFVNDNFIGFKDQTFVASMTPDDIRPNIVFSEKDEQRLKAWAISGSFFRIAYEGGSEIIQLGENRYDVQAGREHAEWDDFFERMCNLGFIEIFDYNNQGTPLYKLKTKGYEYVDSIK